MADRWQDALEQHAREVLPAPLLEYVLQGAREGVTAHEAGAAWAAVRFVPHVLRDVTDVDLTGVLLGRPSQVPWGIAPTTLQRAVHPDGEVAMAQAAGEAGAVVVVSSNAGSAFAEIGATGARWWLQAYLPQDRSLAEPLLDRAVAAGAEAVVLTLDTPVVGTKYAAGECAVWDAVDPALLRVNFDPGYADHPGSTKATDLGGADIAWLAQRTGLPVVVKGVLRPDDARRCVQAGAVAVWVSNHGGRQLDRTASTASCLAGVRAALGSPTPVFVDGGVRSGLDVLAALALGADHVFLGRLPLLALAGGRDGVATALARLREEAVEALRLAGCATLADARAVAAPEPLHRP